MKRFLLFILPLMLTVLLTFAAAQAEETVVMSASLFDAERVVLLREGETLSLGVQVWQENSWVTIVKNDRVLEGIADYDSLDTDYVPEGYKNMTDRHFVFTDFFSMSAYRNDTVAGSRNTLHWGDLVTLHWGKEHPGFSLILKREAEANYSIVIYKNDQKDLSFEMQPDGILFKHGAFNAGLSHDTAADTTLAGFDPDVFAHMQNAMQEECKGAGEVLSAFSEFEPLLIAPHENIRLPVYAAPSEKAPQSGNGKASVSLNDWLCVLGREDGWLFIAYETSDGHYRTGYIRPDSACLQIARTYAGALEDYFLYRGDVSSCGILTIFDDPINWHGEVCTLPCDGKVLFLAHFGDLNYVHYVDESGRVWRGFAYKDFFGNG